MDKVPERRPSAIEILQDHYIKQHMEVNSYTLNNYYHKATLDTESETITYIKFISEIKCNRRS